MRPIDADALIKYMCDHCGATCNLEDECCANVDAVENAPTINLEDCRPSGRWLERQIPLNWCEDDADIIYICSECEGNNFCETPYCPHCGAKMDGKEQNNA